MRPSPAKSDSTPVDNRGLIPPQRILVVRYRFIGDTLLTVPFLRNLRRAYPQAIIHMLSAPQSGEVLRDCPYLDALLPFDTTRKHHYENTDAAPRGFWSYVKQLRETQYDMAFVLKRSFSSAALVALAGIPIRVGFDTECRGLLLTHRVPYGRDPHQHERDRFLDLLRAVNLPVTDDHLEAWWSPAEMKKAEMLMQDIDGHLNLLIHITSSNPAKEWPLASWQRLVRWLFTDFQATLDVPLSLHAVGAPSDKHCYDALLAGLPAELKAHSPIQFHNHCGQTTLTESLALLSQMQGGIGVDSGTLHMAAAVGVPVIGLFGPMNPRQWGPVGEHHQILTPPDGSGRLTALPVETVIEACTIQTPYWNGRRSLRTCLPGA